MRNQRELIAPSVAKMVEYVATGLHQPSVRRLKSVQGYFKDDPLVKVFQF